MENISKKRILTLILIGLIIINIAAFSTMMYLRHKSRRPDQKEFKRNELPNRQHERVKDFVRKELQLNDDQFRNYCELKDLNQKNAGEMWDKLKTLREASLTEICSENPDTARLSAYSDSIGIYHKKIHFEMNRHFLAVKKILEPGQIPKFNEMIMHVERGERQRPRMEREPRDK